jgi:mannose-1-phosphate guanylyltransferase
MQLVILCGGSGTRLWPVSRSLFPKQFSQLFGDESLFQKTLKRNISVSDSISVVINQEQYFMGLDQLEQLKLNRKFQFILEPVGRNTAPAIALAALAAKPDEILLIVPSDHLILNQSSYEKVLSQAIQMASQNNLVTFGIKPTYPETGYGYIEASGFDVKSFKEKPSEKYLGIGIIPDIGIPFLSVVVIPGICILMLNVKCPLILSVSTTPLITVMFGSM